jgi:hypothetical protein
MKLIARIFAETGIRDLFWLLHATIRKHGQKAQTVRLRNQWVPVDPREWKTRNDLTVNVGLGSGSKAQQLQEIQLIINSQSQAVAAGKTNLVSDQNLYASAKQLTKIVGHKDVDAFFTDPSKVPPPQPQPNPEMIKAQAAQQQTQAQMQLQQAKMQADTMHEQAKMQADAALEQQKFEHQKQLAFIEMGMKQEAHRMNMVGLAAKHVTQPGAEGQAPQVDHQALAGILSSFQPPKPKGMRVVRDEQGRVSHTVPIE